MVICSCLLFIDILPLHLFIALFIYSYDRVPCVDKRDELEDLEDIWILENI